MASGIYKIQSISNPERNYIGSAVNVEKRWRVHLSYLKRGDHHSIKLQNHYNKYGISDLIFTFIEPCFPEFIVAREQYYLDLLNPWFNICKVAGSTLGKKHSELTKAKIGVKSRGRKVSEELREKMSITRRGKKMPLRSEEHKQKISNALRGKKKKPLSKETKLKIKIANTGKVFSEETRKKMSENNIAKRQKPWITGKHHSDKSIRKMKKNRKSTIGINNPMFGKHHSEETKKKLRELKLLYYANKKIA